MLNLNFKPFPTLLTERLILRRLELADVDEIFELRSNKEVNEFIERPKAITKDDANEFIKKINAAIDNNESIYWVISLKNNPRLTGTICLWNIVSKDMVAEIGYELHPSYQGKGIMQEAISKVIDFAFKEMRVTTILAFTNFQNHKSSKILEKSGFIKSGEHISEENKKEIIYSLKM